MKYIWKQYMKVPFVLKMSVGFLLGIIVGLVFKSDAEILKPFGTVLIHLLSLIAIPVIFLTVVQAVNKMSMRQLGRMGWKLILYYAATTAAAVFIGLGLAFLFNPGTNLELPNTQVEEPKAPQFGDVLLQIIPDNLFQAFAGGDTLAIMFLAIIMGIAISWMKFSADSKMQEYGGLLDKVFTAFNEMFYILLRGVLAYAPIGVFAISAATFGQQGWETIQSLLKFVGVFYLGLLLLWVVVYAGFLKVTGNSVITFFKQTKEAYSTAFFTSSSIASLPVAIQSAKKAGISEKTANFALPLGAIFNSDGGALRMGVSIVFAANVTNLHLSVTDLLMIVLVGTLLSIGTSGVPAAGLVTLSAVLTMFGLPLEIVALIAGVDAIIGMGGTASNVTGDIVGAAVVDRSEANG
ncbi:Na+/H+-dicarboxylate symporter [Bacillus sp. V-88]|uniref:dicarboxylate/amino acid:cation symporter n=1 Tax=Rossellomorea vietnamensis TaxID=218284 RepID=UPI00068F1478|nr:dicarboxylate/amino acid:cation symporter [Rossellomorea vietnamensis]OXS57853.1 dicarboxylate/amino acid:cation symporter [Bacillus sp. DSM 27956]PRX75173.1 Na+/H+-dicarboxylate symporter [Bacillus sp. V-88]SLK23866.1 Na+/H+-dicarboxylate symporter [Bacillus sp. V-88]